MEEEMSLDLVESICILRKRKKLILLITIFSTVVSALLSFYAIPPTYEAKVTLVVGKADADPKNRSKYEYDDIMMFQNLIKTYGEIAKSTAVAENAAARLNNIPSKDILKDLTVTPVINTQIIEFKVQNNNPQEAYLILNAVYNAFMQEAKRIFPGQNIEIMDDMKVPQEPVKPKKLLNIGIAFFIGLMGSVGIAFLLEYIDRTVKTEEDISRYLDLAVIGVIPKDNDKY